MADDGRQMADDRWQRTDDGWQMTDDRGRMAEGCIRGVDQLPVTSNKQPVTSIRNREGQNGIYKKRITIGTTEPAMLMDAGGCGEPKVL